MSDRLPLFIITGFLGSGKTTLVQRFLREPQAQGTGVVVNEFGEAGLDHRLMVHAAENVELIGNGCMCCARRADVGRALYDLVRMSRQEGQSRFIRAIIETSGLADPSPIVGTIARDPWLRQHVELVSVIAVIDAVAGVRNLRDFDEARRQVAIADALVVTKTDLRAAQETRTVMAAATAIAPDLVLHEAQDPDFSLARLFGRPDRAVTSRGGTPFSAIEVPDHDRSVGSFTLALPERIDWPAFTLWLSALLHRHGDRILRVKGLVRTSAGANPVVIHGVQHSMHPPVHLVGEDLGQPSFLIFITKGLSRDPIAQSLYSFLDLATFESRPGLPGAA
ncbi:MAG TPA: GTP-binding protein [Nitrobacter sp.]|jgi:G3E family GTPase|nr:GTP-binding protein [Nitrobacter sp.]